MVRVSSLSFVFVAEPLVGDLAVGGRPAEDSTLPDEVWQQGKGDYGGW
jgi:hypothetical protein